MNAKWKRRDRLPYTVVRISVNEKGELFLAYVDMAGKPIYWNRTKTTKETIGEQLDGILQMNIQLWAEDLKKRRVEDER